ncbi:methenyltetrahydrofolate synthase domain-containing protein isoform X1 [Myripristis murdjan]|uniref:Methenyltetrahydrofolate synthase domain-containing protein n=1 Tax=Myripristis murdjan TaxID=586833 RepID=A0A667XZT2_9TELE|nr:methenyltetrahydrofolate synthase domain-containing protein isoform X1 [Myripristis murdjan]
MTEPVINIHPGATKWDIRQKIWDYIEEKNLANFPRPVHNRIPNFKGAFTACAKVSELPVFTQTDEVKVDPDKPLEGVRLAVLQARKTLLVPTPRLQSGLFNKITPPQGASKEQLRVCSTSQGVKEFSVPVGLDAKVKVDLVVVGSVAVSEKGYRIGKGEGYADMEYGMMVAMGAVNESTVVVTVVHDCQVVDIPEELIESHDLTVDYILTPTKVVKTECKRPKPQGIIWTKLDTSKLEKIPILKKLLALEEQSGKDVTLGTAPAAGEPGFPADYKPKRQTRRRPRRSTQQDAEGESREDAKQENRVELGQKPRSRPARVRKESKGEVREDGKVEGRGGRGGESKELEKDMTGKSGGRRREKAPEDRESETVSQRRLPPSVTTVYLGGIPPGLRVSELKTALREREAVPLRLTWQGAQHRAFLDYTDPEAADQALEALQGLSLNGHNLQAVLAKSQRGGRRSGLPNRRPKPATAPKTKPAPSECSDDTHDEKTKQ